VGLNFIGVLKAA